MRKQTIVHKKVWQKKQQLIIKNIYANAIFKWSTKLEGDAEETPANKNTGDIAKIREKVRLKNH